MGEMSVTVRQTGPQWALNNCYHRNDYLLLLLLCVLIVIYCLDFRSTLSVIAAYLDAFQKIADSATNAKGNMKHELLTN